MAMATAVANLSFVVAEFFDELGIVIDRAEFEWGWWLAQTRADIAEWKECFDLHSRELSSRCGNVASGFRAQIKQANRFAL